ncbi:MAG: OmpA family protein [Bradymonadales bacterium]
MTFKKISLLFAILATSLLLACASAPPPDDALQSAVDAIDGASQAEECAAQTYALAKKALLEAQEAYNAGNNELAKQKALTAQTLAKQAQEEAKLNAEECERLRLARAAVEEKLEETPVVVTQTEETANFRVVYFDFDEYVISSHASEAILYNSDLLKKQPAINVNLASHTDERGTSEYNLALSQKRGESVKQYIINLGVEATRMHVVPYGKEMPAAFGSREQDHALNRRVEFLRR